jgi:DNA-binding GntR family transcriptional regulator
MAPVLRSELQARIAESVMEHIAARGLAAGQRMNLDSFARGLGVSRTPVQAAFEHLVREGVLELKPNRGYFIKRLGRRPPRPAMGGARLYDRIVDDMAMGTLSGALTESALMRRYAVDRGGLGAVLRRLNREGLVAPSLGRGWVFIAFNLDILREGYQLRALVEPGYIRDPALRIDAARLDGLRRDHEAMLAKLSPRTPFEDTFALDARFHETLAEFTGNRFFIELIRTQSNIRRLSEYLGRTRLENVRRSFRDHLEIIEALQAGERDWAAAVMQRHLTHSDGRAARYFEDDIGAIRAGEAAPAPSRRKR